MNEEALGAEVSAAEPVVTPEVQSEAPVESGEQERGTVADAVRRAFEKVDAKTEGEEGQGQPRGPDGKFVNKGAQAQPAEAQTQEKSEGEREKPTANHDAPARFSVDAKAEWEGVPASVKGEIGRAITELEQGIQRYRDEMEPLKPYKEMAGDLGLEGALRGYANIEALLRTEPLRAMELIAQKSGTTLDAVMAMKTGQTPDQAQQARDTEIAGLRGQIAALQQQLGGVTQTVQQSRESEAQRMVADFAADRPRFGELSERIAELINKGMASSLPEAYEMAERLNPVTAPAQQAQPAPAPAQNRVANLSVQGAPKGSNPASRPRSKTPRDAVSNAFAQTGLI